MFLITTHRKNTLQNNARKEQKAHSWLFVHVAGGCLKPSTHMRTFAWQSCVLRSVVPGTVHYKARAGSSNFHDVHAFRAKSVGQNSTASVFNTHAHGRGSRQAVVPLVETTFRIQTEALSCPFLPWLYSMYIRVGEGTEPCGFRVPYTSRNQPCSNLL